MKRLPKHLETFWIFLAVTAVLVVGDYLWFGTMPKIYDLRFSLGILGFMLFFDTFKLANTDIGTDFTTTVR